MWWFQLFSLLFSLKFLVSCWNSAFLKCPPGLHQFSDFISCSHTDSSEHAGKPLSPAWQCSQPSGTSPAASYLKESKGFFKKGLFDWCFDHIAATVDETLFLLSVDLCGELNSCRKSKHITIYFKKRSLTILYCQRIQCEVLSALQLLLCSVPD